MKHLFTFLFSLVVSLSWAQKKELKQAQKLYKAGKTAEASVSLDANQTILEGSELKYATEYNFLRSQIALDNSEFQLAYDYLLLAKKNSKLKLKIADLQQNIVSEVVNASIQQSEEKQYVLSAKNLHLAYSIDPVVNIDYLYYAASNAVNAPDYELAIEYYSILRDVKYTGVKKQYFVTEIANNTEKEVSESEFNIFKKTKDYTNFREAETESKFPEIVKNIALIYNKLGLKDKAISAVKDARAESPTDLGLILTEANIYIELGEKGKFKDLMGEAIAQDPNNGNLYYNLAVVTNDLGDKEKARSYYEKAIALQPEMENAYLNLVALILEEESSIVEEMNSLGNSRADNAKYDLLTNKREALYKECIPILRDFLKVSENNNEAIRMLKNIYGTIGDNEGFMEMKRLLDAQE